MSGLQGAMMSVSVGGQGQGLRRMEREKRLVAGLEGFESCHERGKVGREESDVEFSRDGGFG